VQIAIDSSVLVALLNPIDLWHPQALALREALVNYEKTNPLSTSRGATTS